MLIKIYSDVADTWSYGEEKVLRAVDYLYNGEVKFYNIIGGLFNDYRDLLPMNMKDKDSTEMANKILFEMWKTGENFHKMPITEIMPSILSTEKSSVYPLDIAFVAARLTNEDMANSYLRNIRIATILDNRNTMNREVQIEIAKETGIDVEDYIYNLDNEAQMVFLDDRMETFDHRLTLFPDFLYKNEDGREILIKGYKKFEELCDFIESNSDLRRREIKTEAKSIIDFLNKYERVFKVELEEVFDKNILDDILNEMEKENLISIVKSGTGYEVKLNN